MEQSLIKEIHELEPSTLIVLYELVLKDHAASYRFHAGENGLNTEINFKGNNYYYIPIKTEGFENTESTLARPTLTIDNTDSFFSLKTRFFKDFIGYTVKRTRTFVKFLHGSNFPNNTNPFGSATEVSFPVEKYVINRKIAENPSIIQFELATPMESEQAFIPNRKLIYNTCQWQYRDGIGCGYTGLPVTDGKGNFLNFNSASNRGIYSSTTTYNSGDFVKVVPAPDSNAPEKVYVCLQNGTVDKKPSNDKASWILDNCAKNISGCRCRFGEQDVANAWGEKIYGLPFGGFPGSWNY